MDKEAICIASTTCLSILYLAFSRYRNRDKYLAHTKFPSLIVSLKKRKYAMTLLTGILFGGWVNETLQYALKNPIEPYTVLSLITFCITWLAFFIFTLASPSLNHYNNRHYIFVFSFFFSVATIQSIYHLLIVDKVDAWDCVVVVVSFALFLISTTTPQPFHPRDLLDDKDTEVKEGNVYRNGLPLSPEATASILSWISFQWMNPMVVFGFHNTLIRENLYALTFQHKTRSAYEDFIKASQPKILSRIYHANKQEIWISLVFSILACLVSFCGPVFQQLLLEYFEAPSGRPVQVAYLYVLGLFLVGVVKLLFNSIQLWTTRRWNVRAFIMLDTELFNKTLKRKETSGKIESDKQELSGVGKITNLMSVDAEKLSSMPLYIFMIFNAPIEISVGIFYLYTLLGTSALVGLAVMVLSFPISTYLSKQYGKRFKKLSSAKDNRNSLLNELLQGIRMVKCFSWEDQWTNKIKEARRQEIAKLIKVATFEIVTNIVYLSVPVLVTVVTFAWYTKVAGHTLTASVTFVSISLFEMLRRPLYFLPEAVITVTEASVSLNRIQTYLDEPELDRFTDTRKDVSRVGFEKAIFQWHFESDSIDPGSKPFQLNVPQFDFPVGQLSLVVGATGSGKSSFLYALLGEMDMVSGRVYLPSQLETTGVDPEYPGLYTNKVAYVSQQPFLQHASIRDNILFGLPLDEARYKRVLYQCALIKDLSILTDGDLTEIGEKGISLSGGQKQRVSLARAVYSYAKTVLLDDCLSAVDAHTSKHIMKECILGGLFHGRTVILVTHHVRICLPSAKFLVKINQGHVLGCDSIENLKKADQLSDLVGEEFEAEDEEETIEDILEDIDLSAKKDAAQLIKEETSEKGQVKLKVYATYFAACGGWLFWTTLLLAYTVSRFLLFAENWWLRVWAAAYGPNTLMVMSTRPPIVQEHTVSSTFLHSQNIFKPFADKQVNVDYYLAVYAGIVTFSVLFDILRSILIYLGSILGARKLFNQLTDRVIRAPMRFFDTTPVGRLLNRFSKDISVVDLSLGRSASSLLQCVTGIVSSIVVMSAITPEFIIVSVIIGGLYFTIGLFYLRASRELKRLNSVSRSPIFSHFTESLMGVTTIRAYSVQEQFMDSVYQKIDGFITPFYFLWMTNRWLYARIEFVGAFVTLFCGIFLVVNMNRIDVGMAGISLFYARNFLDYVYWFIRQYTQVEMNLNSVERIQEYLEIDQEAPDRIEGSCPPAAWPTEGLIKVEDLVIRYADTLDPVLHGISFSTRAHEKIGIVGRTGSGKSTMGLSLFRFLEASEGSIWIDGIDIAKIGLHDLRSRMTIIPQDVVLFNGTIRFNLDPFDEHSDEAIWESLERAHLSHPSDRAKLLSGESGSIKDSSVTSLSLQVSEGGNNFSQGQRQLLCLARALLRNSKIIIMDEATASVDFETDKKIQATIRNEFSNSTLLCIAHRLYTIIDYDRVLVLDQGKIVEFDTPHNLLLYEGGIFKSMCEQSGEYSVLREMVQGDKDSENF